MWVCGFYRTNFDLSGRISADRSYFRKIYLSKSFHLKILTLTRWIYFRTPIFVNFAQIPYFTVYNVWARSSSRGVLMKKFLHNEKVWSLDFPTPCRTYLCDSSILRYLSLKFKKSLNDQLCRAFSCVETLRNVCQNRYEFFYVLDSLRLKIFCDYQKVQFSP